MNPSLRDKVEHVGIQWNESRMSTGIPQIDEQHKEWIARFNTFNQAVEENLGTETFSDALLFFLRYTQTHFHFEETLMTMYHCSAEGRNKLEHERFEKRIHELSFQTWPLGATPEEVLLLRNELGDWLVSHICKTDVALREVAHCL